MGGKYKKPHKMPSSGITKNIPRNKQKRNQNASLTQDESMDALTKLDYHSVFVKNVVSCLHQHEKSLAFVPPSAVVVTIADDNTSNANKRNYWRNNMKKTIEQPKNNTQLALKLARQYFERNHTKWLDYVDDLYVLFSHEEPEFWRCYVSCNEMDKYGEHLFIEHHQPSCETSIQYCVPDDDKSLFIFSNGKIL